MSKRFGELALGKGFWVARTSFDPDERPVSMGQRSPVKRHRRHSGAGAERTASIDRSELALCSLAPAISMMKTPEPGTGDDVADAEVFLSCP